MRLRANRRGNEHDFQTAPAARFGRDSKLRANRFGTFFNQPGTFLQVVKFSGRKLATKVKADTVILNAQQIESAHCPKFDCDIARPAVLVDIGQRLLCYADEFTASLTW